VEVSNQLQGPFWRMHASPDMLHPACLCPVAWGCRILATGVVEGWGRQTGHNARCSCPGKTAVASWHFDGHV